MWPNCCPSLSIPCPGADDDFDSTASCPSLAVLSDNLELYHVHLVHSMTCATIIEHIRRLSAPSSAATTTEVAVATPTAVRYRTLS